jgi:biopolymer transport protein ExbD
MRSKKFNRRGKKEFEELDITSLLDVLVILLVFLLKSYSSSSFELITPENLLAPQSLSLKEGIKNPTVKITSEGDIYLEEKLLSNINQDSQLSALKGELISLDEKAKDNLNLLIDRSVKFKTIDKSVKVASVVGIKKISLIVRHKE